MSKFQIKKATKEQARLRMALHGPSGSGKTYSALRIALAMGKRVCLVDTERGSASKYANEFDFDVLEVEDNYSPQRLIEMLRFIEGEGYDVVVIDSMTHFWNGSGGFLELVDAEVKRMTARGGKADSFAAWKNVDPIYKKMVHAIQTSKAHVIVTLRAKTEYAKEEGANGKTKIRKVGMAPEMRDNFQYEMDVEGMLDIDHSLAIGKTRCNPLDGRVFDKPGEDVAKILSDWLADGVPRSEKPAPQSSTEASTPEPSPADALLAKFALASTETEITDIQSEVRRAKESLSKDDIARLVEASNAAKARLAAQAAE